MTEYRENKDVRRPFLSAPDARVYFPASTVEKARKNISRCLRRGEGVALTLGPTGVGKTLLARVLSSEFDADDLVSFVSVSRKLDVKSFLQQFMFSLHQQFSGCDETELRLMTLDYLERAQNRRCVLLVDDAHNLSLRVFDEIRRLIDETSGMGKQLSAALFGSNSLEERLNLPQLFPFQQRIVSRSYLEVYTRKETSEYIDAELRRTGASAAFTKDAKDEVMKRSEGSPRIVAQLCDRALWLASDGAFETSEGLSVKPGKRATKRSSVRFTIDVAEVERAWHDLQSLPEDELASTIVDDGSPTIEFGLLDDDEDEEYNTSSASAVGAETPTGGEIDAKASEKSPEESQSEVASDTETLETVEPEQKQEEVKQEPEQAKESSVEEGAADESALEAQVDSNRPESNASSESFVAEASDKSTRRSAAKRAFWNEGDATVFVAGLGAQESETDASKDSTIDATESISSGDLEDSEEEAEEEEEEEFEEGFNDYEINQALDARLREKYGFGIDSLQNADEIAEPEDSTDEEESESGVDAKVSEPPRASSSNTETGSKSQVVYRDGMKFDISDRRHATGSDSYDPNDGRVETTLDGLFADSPQNVKYGYDESLAINTTATGGQYTKNLDKRSITRRRIYGGNDGSGEYVKYNGFKAEDSSRLGESDTIQAPKFGTSSESTSSGSTPSGTDGNGRDRISVNASSDRYLQELNLLEEQIAEEANLIRRIRNIHMQLRATVNGGSEDRGR